ncbi:unnamed protein product [Ectocarpus sp. 13 AM-2016]
MCLNVTFGYCDGCTMKASPLTCGGTVHSRSFPWGRAVAKYELSDNSKLEAQQQTESHQVAICKLGKAAMARRRVLKSIEKHLLVERETFVNFQILLAERVPKAPTRHDCKWWFSSI